MKSEAGQGRRSGSDLTAADKRLVEQVESLYGPPRWTMGSWLTKPEGRPPRPPLPRRPLKPLVLGTLLSLAAAFLSWYAVIGGDVSVTSTLSIVLRATGLQSPHVAPEYLLASGTLGNADALAPTDPLVLQFKGLLDGMAPKCVEDRLALATAVISARDAMAARGIRESSLSILAQADENLSESTRRTWPTSCGAVIDRIVAARTATR